jgi:hypothetical protein
VGGGRGPPGDGGPGDGAKLPPVLIAGGADLLEGEPGGEGGTDQRGDDLGHDDPGEPRRHEPRDLGGDAAGGGLRKGPAQRPPAEFGPAAGRLDLGDDSAHQVTRAEARLAGQRAEIGAQSGFEHEEDEHLGEGGDPDGAEGDTAGWRCCR